MSFPKNDRIIRSKSGKTFPNPADAAARPTFAGAIADALVEEFGDTPSSVKTVARLVGANERAVRNWFEAKNGPSGEHLVVLMQHSDAVLAATLGRAKREHLLKAAIASNAWQKLRELCAVLESLEP